MTDNVCYNVQLNADGIVRFKMTVPAREAGLVGDYLNGVPYQPDMQALISKLPYRYRKAAERARVFWQREGQSGRCMPLMCDLWTLRGKPMGTLFATPNWAAL